MQRAVSQQKTGALQPTSIPTPVGTLLIFLKPRQIAQQATWRMFIPTYHLRNTVKASMDRSYCSTIMLHQVFHVSLIA